MIEKLKGFPANVLAFACRGQVTRRDYDSVLIPAVEAALKGHDKVRLYYETGPDFIGIEAGAVLEDFKVGVEHLGRWERVALVSDVEWIRTAVRAFGFRYQAMSGRFISVKRPRRARGSPQPDAELSLTEEPAQRFAFLDFVECSHRGMQEHSHRANQPVLPFVPSDDRDAFHLLLVILHERRVRLESSDVLPALQTRPIDQKSDFAVPADDRTPPRARVGGNRRLFSRSGATIFRASGAMTSVLII